MPFFSYKILFIFFYNYLSISSINYLQNSDALFDFSIFHKINPLIFKISFFPNNYMWTAILYNNPGNDTL